MLIRGRFERKFKAGAGPAFRDGDGADVVGVEFEEHEGGGDVTIIDPDNPLGSRGAAKDDEIDGEDEEGDEAAGDEDDADEDDADDADEEEDEEEGEEAAAEGDEKAPAIDPATATVEQLADTKDVRVLRTVAKEWAGTRQRLGPWTEPKLIDRLVATRPIAAEVAELLGSLTGLDALDLDPQEFEERVTKVNPEAMSKYKKMVLEDEAEDFAIPKIAEQVGISVEEVVRRINGEPVKPAPSRASRSVEGFLSELEKDPQDAAAVKVAEEIRAVYNALGTRERQLAERDRAEADRQKAAEVEKSRGLEAQFFDELAKTIDEVLREAQVRPGAPKSKEFLRYKDLHNHASIEFWNSPEGRKAAQAAKAAFARGAHALTKTSMGTAKSVVATVLAARLKEEAALAPKGEKGVRKGAKGTAKGAERAPEREAKRRPPETRGGNSRPSRAAERESNEDDLRSESAAIKSILASVDPKHRDHNRGYRRG